MAQVYKVIVIVRKLAILVLFFFTGYSYAASDNICSGESVNMSVSTPSERFLAPPESDVVSDKITNLMWARCELGFRWSNSLQCEEDGNTTSKFNWEDALTAVETANTATFLGYSDWRLPNIKELGSIVEYKCAKPAINSEIFSGARSASVWTNTPTDSSTVWFVSFFYGSVGAASINESNYVRLVRDISP